MKRIILTVVIVLYVSSSLLAREVINMNKGWSFGKIISNSQLSTIVDIPHTWHKMESDPKFALYRGNCHYIKEFAVPYSWQSKNIFIRFKGVASIANVFVNGKFVGEHRGAYTAFTLDITPYLKYGSSNTILVSVDNSSQLDIMPIGGDYNVYGGIYRDVDLIITEKAHISTTHYSSDGVYVEQSKITAKEARINVKVMLKAQYGDKTITKVKILNEGSEIAQKSVITTTNIDGENELNIPFEIDSPRLWSGKKDPFLYVCEVEVNDAVGNKKDNIKVTFGLRNILISRQTGFKLNGDDYPLRGVTYVQDKEEVYSALSPLDRIEDMELIEEIGATAIRTSNAPHHNHIYDMTDRNGIVVWVDLPFTGNDLERGINFVNSAEFMNNGKEQLKEIIYQNFNHPSIAFWGLFSNISGYGSTPSSYINELNTIVRNITPWVMTVGCSNENGALNNITNAISWSQYLGWRTRKASDIYLWLNGFINEWGKLYPAIGEYGAGGSIYQQDELKKECSEKDLFHSESYQTDFHITYTNALIDRPYIWGAFVNSIFDYGSSYRSTGAVSGLNDMGLVTYNRHVKKDAFYLYKSQWNKEDRFIHINERRIYRRSGLSQSISIFSNCRTVDLLVNGLNHSTVTVINGMAQWSNILFKEGINIVTARSGEIEDKIEFEIFSK